MKRLTIKEIDTAPSKDKEYKLHDGEGLFLRVRPSGAKSWLFSFQLPGTKNLIRMTLGSLSELSLKEARELIPALHKQVKQGIDPRHTRATSTATNMAQITTQKLFDLWIVFLRDVAQKDRKTIQHHEGRWKHHFKKQLGQVLAKDITRAHIASNIDILVQKGIRNQAVKSLIMLNMLFDYGLNRHYIDQNPARQLKPRDFGLKISNPRDRVLSMQELQTLWQGLDILKTDHEQTISNMIKLLILTGARRGELSKMRWEDLDLRLGMWIIPANMTKNKQQHIIYFGSLAIQILTELYKIRSSESVFNVHPDTLTSILPKLRKLPELQNFKHFTLHDLRRSAATAWGEHLKTPPHIIEKMLNHKPINKLVAVYQRAEFIEEQKLAWGSWDNLIANLFPIYFEDSPNLQFS